MAYDLIKISALPAATPDESQEIVVGVGDLAKRINYGDVKADMVGTSPSYTTDTEPYLIRQTTNVGVVGKCALNKLVGGSLGWNQLTPTATISQTSSGITFSSSNNGTISVSGTATARAVCNIGSTISGKLGHVFLIKGCPSGGSAGTYWLADGYDGGGTQKDIGSGIIIKKATDTYITQIVVASGTALSGTKTFVPQAFDLTAMFGSTIADYVYGLESATAGAGVAWLSKYIDLGTYHAYDAGSIQSVQATAHVTKDANDNVIGNYPLGSDTLRGIPQLVSNKIQFDGDEKYPDGTIRRRYGTVDLGTLNWGYATNYGGAFYANLPSEVANTVTGGLAGVCGRYALFQGGASEFTNADKVFTLCNQNFTSLKRIQLKDSAYTDQATFKASVSGVYLVYPLATETTESSTSYQKIQTIDADGTESFTTSSPVPVGHETQTPDNILSALEWLGE